MEFFDRFRETAGSFGSAVSKKTGEMVETGRLKSRITASNETISDCQKQIGIVIYGMFANGDRIAPELEELCRSIRAEKETIENCNAQIRALKTANGQASPGVSQADRSVRCPSCGACNPTGAAFCEKCGAHLGAAPASMPPVCRCPSCGYAVPSDCRFCPNCGADLGSSTTDGTPSGPVVSESFTAEGTETAEDRPEP